MSNSTMYLNLPLDVLNRIYMLVINDTQGDLEVICDLALINKIGSKLINSLFQSRWGELKSWFFSKSFVVIYHVIYNFMDAIEPSTSPQSLFKKLKNDQLLASVGDTFFLKPLSYTCDDMETFFQLNNDKALCSIWPRINAELPLQLRNNSLKTADEIREHINSLEETEALLSIETLDLSDLKLNVIPSELNKLSNLKHVTLYNNKITFIPELSLKKLESLNLRNNCIKTSDFSEITNLKILDLGNNQIEIIPNSIFQLTNIEKICLDNNRIKTIPDSISKLINLKELFLSRNQIKDLGPLSKLTGLEKLYLKYNEITNIDLISELVHLIELDLSCNKILTIPDLCVLTALKKLNLSYNKGLEIPTTLYDRGEWEVILPFDPRFKSDPDL
jgi:hypothetical protein